MINPTRIPIFDLEMTIGKVIHKHRLGGFELIEKKILC